MTMCELYTVDQYNEGSDGQMVSKSYERHIRIAPKSTRASVASNSITSGRGRRKEKEIFTAKNASWIRTRCRYIGEAQTISNSSNYSGLKLQKY